MGNSINSADNQHRGVETDNYVVEATVAQAKDDESLESLE